MHSPRGSRYLRSCRSLEGNACHVLTRGNRTPLTSLLSFLDDPGNSHLIRWSESGDSFIVVDEDEFASTLIPELFKHKKYPSFVRQLNMYGFHKKVGLSDNSMRASERKNKTPSEYYNPYFKRDRPGLVWLIYKPKNAQNKNIGKGGSRGNQEGGGFDDDADEMFNIDNSARAGKAALEGGSGIHHGRQPLMIGDTPAGNTPQDIHQELQAIRKQQQMIAALLQKTRVEHEALYEQAAKFQELHDRHENSINAILTFLATVYNRSLEGKGGGNLGNMFGAIPHDAQGQGNVVDVGDYNEHNLANGQAQGGFRRQPLLLDAPPVNNRGVSATSPAASVDDGASQTQNQPYLRSHAAAHSPAVQEVFDRTPSNRSSQSPQVKPDTPNEGQIPEADILSMINSTNANTPNFPGGRMDFPQALSHLQTADGQSPLTQNQRNDVLRLMASSAAATSQSGNNNALTSPSPPMPTMALYQQSKERLDQLHNALKQQNDKVKELSQYLAPLSPSGSIPGITDTQTYGDPSGADSLDLDQFLNTGDYFNEPGNGPFDFGTSDNLPDFSFDAPADSVSGPPGLGGTMSGNEEGRVVETANSSEATSPANTVDESYAGQEEGRSPGKRRRKA